MKPIKLTIEGINSFDEMQSVDFLSLGADNIFCISGVTGSGKTTILDCILLALYGRNGERGDKLVDYINLRREWGKVVFTFEEGGEEYSCERLIHRKEGKCKNLVYKNGEAVCDGKAATDYIQELIGLSVDEFTNVVVLQQGQFARFLKSSKKYRRGVIEKLFNLRRFNGIYGKISAKAAEYQARAAATEKAVEGMTVTEDGVKAREAELETSKREYNDALAAAEKAKKSALAVQKAREEYVRNEQIKADVEKKKSALEALDGSERRRIIAERELIDAEREFEKTEKGRDVLVSKKVLLGEEVNAFSEIEREERDIAELKKKFGEHESAMRALEGETKALEKKFNERSSAIKSEAEACGLSGEDIRSFAIKKAQEIGTEIRLHEERVKQIADKKSECEKKEREERTQFEAHTAALAAHNELSERVKIAIERAKEARAEYERETAADAAALLRSGLKAGDACPICGHMIEKTYGGEERATRAADLLKEATELEKAAESARENLAASTAHVSASAEKLASAKKAAESERKRLSELENGFGTFDAAKAAKEAERLNDLERSCAELERIEGVLNKSKARLDVEIAASSERGKSLALREQALEKRKSALSPDARSAKSELEKIENALLEMDKNKNEFRRRREVYEANALKLKEQRASLKVEIKSLESQLKALTEVSEEETAKAVSAAELAEAEERRLLSLCSAEASGVERDKKELERLCGLVRECESARNEQKRYEGLAKLFKSDAFMEFVAAEYVKEFTLAASDILSELTGGKYRMDYDEGLGEFFVTDFLSGNARRGVKTLSGGETFLASLALAIAISGSLSKQRNYEFFFIDEGFGTLSPDAIDTVVAALETLSRDTLVGIITHRSELIERIPMVARVEPATESEGSKIVW